MSTVKMARMLSAHGHEVAVFSFAVSGHMDRAPAPIEHALHEGGTSNHRNLEALREWLRAFRPDVTINQMPYEHGITSVLHEHREARHLACLRNTLYSVRNNLDRYADTLLPAPLSGLAKNVIGRAALLQLHKRRHARDLRTILQTYDRFVMFAEPNLEELAFFVPDYDRARISLVPNTIPDVAATLPKKEKRILWLARVSVQQKRADLVLPLWRAVATQLPDWSLDVVGDGPMLAELQRVAAKEGLPRLTFHGRQPSQPFFERSSVFVMTSDFEGFPNTLIEAQSRGAVPVAFDTYPMVRWLIHHEDYGLLVPRGDVQGMADAIVDLCNSTQKRTRMGQRALEAAAQYTEAAVAPQWDRLVRSVVGANPPGRNRGHDG